MDVATRKPVGPTRYHIHRVTLTSQHEALALTQAMMSSAASWLSDRWTDWAIVSPSALMRRQTHCSRFAALGAPRSEVEVARLVGHHLSQAADLSRVRVRNGLCRRLINGLGHR